MMYTFIDAPPGGATNYSFDGEAIATGSAYLFCPIELEISTIELEISPNRTYLEISPIQL